MEDTEIRGEEKDPKKREENLATEIFMEQKVTNKRFFGIIIALILVVLIEGFMFVGYQRWFVDNFAVESYSQDGNGYNNINTGSQGDVVNGAEIPEDKEEEQQ